MVSPDIQLLIVNGRTPGEAKNSLVRSRAEISAKIPDEIDKGMRNLLMDYFRAQLRIAKGQKTRAREILKGLDKKPGFLDFEKNNEPLFAAIDFAVHGRTNRQDELGRPIKPLFKTQ
ncbi:MAG: hypothetical protein AAB685_03260 [Patescibacteria group bacterium]